MSITYVIVKGRFRIIYAGTSNYSVTYSCRTRNYEYASSYTCTNEHDVFTITKSAKEKLC